MEKATFVERVLAFLKGGDSAKVTRFSGKLAKYYEKQIAMRKDQIETAEDKKKDAEETLADAVSNVDLERIQNTDSLEAYVVEYHKSIAKLSATVKGFDEEIESLNEEIESLEEIRDLIFGA